LFPPKPIVAMQQTCMILMEEDDHERYAHISQKKSKPLIKSSTTKQSHKNSYTILERLPNEKRGEHVKA